MCFDFKEIQRLHVRLSLANYPDSHSEFINVACLPVSERPPGLNRAQLHLIPFDFRLVLLPARSVQGYLTHKKTPTPLGPP